MGALVIWGTAGVILEMRKIYKTVFECSWEVGGGGGERDLHIFIKTDILESDVCTKLFVGQFFVCVFFVTDLWIYLQTYILASDGWSLIAAWNIIKPLLFKTFLNRSGNHRKSAVSLKLMRQEKVYTLLWIQAANSCSCACVWIQMAATRRATPTRLSCTAQPRRRRRCTQSQRLTTLAATELTTRAWTTSLMSTTETMR